jgi:hypothetical protein
MQLVAEAMSTTASFDAQDKMFNVHIQAPPAPNNSDRAPVDLVVVCEGVFDGVVVLEGVTDGVSVAVSVDVADSELEPVEEDVAKAAEAKAADRLLMPPPPPRVQPAPPPSHAPPSLAPPPPLRQLQEHHSNQQRSPTSAAAAR